MKLTAADFIAVLIAASTSVALAQIDRYKPTKGAAHFPRNTSLFGHAVQKGQISRAPRVGRAEPANQSAAPGPP
jgi:hypothetical protein